MEPGMILERVAFKYAALWVLRGIELEIAPGEILGVLGPNGSGKSTLLKIMDGMLSPQEGRVLLRDRNLSSFGRAAIAREIAMVAQENHFRFSFPALEVVLMGRFPHLKRLQFESDRDMEIALSCMEATNTRELADRSIHELSGGEKQRVLIARALAQEPKIILLDEPTSFLDLKHKRDIFHLISTLTRNRGLSVVVISHDIDIATQYCHRVLLLKDGCIYSIGEPEKVITSETISAVYDCPVLVDRSPATGRPRVNLAV
ncbi:MAG: ABC transporter ATP-binding protein [Deltaproteobacteria bacterium]|nr:ABC transporter ATP-binding protein [Deltaproteobacteria bacterium]MBW2136179.1 ABC transporter ATP-binding protein [Deltaproteobacteria bacterium]